MASGELIARAGELARIDSARVRATSGTGALVLLVGEAGIGKTRVADEAAIRARQQGMEVAWGRSWEAGGAPAYWPWTQVVRNVVRAYLALEPSLVGIPEIAGVPAGGAAPEPDARFRLFDRTTALLRAAGEQRPLMLVLDDLHAADAASVELLHFVARELRSMRVVVLATYREHEVRARIEMATAVAALEREGDRLPLRRFTREEIAAFVVEAHPSADEALVDAISVATEGNPLCLQETMRWLASRALTGDVPSHDLIPEGVRNAIAGNLERLDAETRLVLSVASVLGREMVAGDLSAAVARAHPELGPGVVEEAVQAACGVGAIATRRGPRGEELVFTHFLVRQSLYDALSPSRRAAVHRHVAVLLEAEDSRDARTAAAVAHHFALAGAASWREAVAHGLRAARTAEDALATHDALRQHEAVLALLDVHAPEDVDSRSEALLGAARAHLAAAANDDARRVVNKAAELARNRRRPDLLARAALTLGGELRSGAVDGTLVTLLEEANATLAPAPSALRASVLARLAAAMQPSLEPDVPPRMAHIAVCMAREVGDPSTLLYTLRWARAAFMPQGRLAERLALDEEALALAESTGDVATSRLCHARLACERLECGELERALVHVGRFEGLCPVDAADRWRGPMLRAMFASLQGDFAAAEALTEAAKRSARPHDGSAAFAIVFHELGRLRAQHRAGDLSAVAARANGGGAAQKFRSAQQILATLFAATERRDRDVAKAAFGALHGAPIPRGVAATTWIAEAAAFVGDREHVEQYYELLVADADVVDVWGLVAFHASGSTHRVLGILAARLGRHEEAVRHFESALAVNAALHAIPWVAATELAWAEAILLREGSLTDEARRRLDRVRAIARGLEMTGLAERVDELTAADAVSSPGVGSAPAIVAEGDSWAITWEGATFRLKDSRGLRLIAHLLARPGEEVHALELAAIVDGRGDVEPQGDLGPALDVRAKSRYRARLADLADGLREAESFGDLGRVARLRAEIDAIAGELAMAVGLGGRDRAQGAAAERARVRVQKRLADAIKRIEPHAPSLARSLTRTIRTGTFCSFRPDLA